MTDALVGAGNSPQIGATDKIKAGGIDNARSLVINGHRWCRGITCLGSFVGRVGVTGSGAHHVVRGQVP